ncbi:DUF4870 domain-containing protein [Kineococcus sp. SYSU DK003]|uniref:DUF4870 domain-containing protein n=1 Tax=Kineococcus sp. SYSU DK003 TaxID=3383124 RepID=UPI003D7D091B
MSEHQYPPPQHHQQYAPAPLSPSDERMWGMFGHLSAIAAGFLTLPFLGPLIVFLVFKDRSGFVRGHSAEALNMTISLVVYEIVLTVVFSILTVVTLGIGSVLFALLAVPAIAALVCAVLAAVAANQGRVYRYPLIIRMVR